MRVWLWRGSTFPAMPSMPRARVDGKTNIAAYEFPLWVAATFSTVDEVEAVLRDTVIVAKSAGEGLGVSLLHWIIGDSQRSIVVEMMADGLHVYDDPVDTLPISPPSRGIWKPAHLYHGHKRFSADGDMAWRRAQALWRWCRHARNSGDCYSPSRFVKAAYLNANYPQKESETENVVRMFRSLEGVVMIEGRPGWAMASSRRLSIPDALARTGNYYYAMYGDPSIRYVSLMDAEGASPDRLVVPEPRRS